MTEPLVYNNQTALDKIWAYALIQNERSMADDGNSCLYNGPDDNHCWVGVLLEGIDIDSAANAEDIGGLIERPEVKSRLKDCNLGFLRGCQVIHDQKGNWDTTWGRDAGRGQRLESLRRVAKAWDLEVPEEST